MQLSTFALLAFASVGLARESIHMLNCGNARTSYQAINVHILIKQPISNNHDMRFGLLT